MPQTKLRGWAVRHAESPDLYMGEGGRVWTKDADRILVGSEWVMRAIAQNHGGVIVQVVKVTVIQEESTPS